MTYIHQHKCPSCKQLHFHEADTQPAAHITFKHQTCLPCLVKQLIAPEPEVKPR